MERLIYPTKDEYGWILWPSQVDDWQRLYTRLDVRAECVKAWAWLDANPTRRKTARGMKRFLVGWLNRATTDPRAAVRPKPKDYIWPCPHAERHGSQTLCRNQQFLDAARAERARLG